MRSIYSFLEDENYFLIMVKILMQYLNFCQDLKMKFYILMDKINVEYRNSALNKIFES